MQLKSRALWLASLITLSLSGCSSFTGKNSVIVNRDTDYLSAQSIPPMQIPPGYASNTISAHYPIPAKGYAKPTQPISLIPPELN